NCVFNRSAVRILDLRPSCEPGLYQMSLRVVQDDLAQTVDKYRTLRPRAHKIHIASKHVDELRQFVEAELAHDSTDACDARIIFLCPHWARIVLRSNSHRAKLDYLERSPLLTYALLHVEDRPT